MQINNDVSFRFVNITEVSRVRIEQYLYIVEIADSGSFSQAARNLFVSQPSLSYAVKQVEKKLGIPIFERSGSGVIPTRVGSELIKQLRFLKKEYEMVENQINFSELSSRLSFCAATLNMVTTNCAFQALVERYCSAPINFMLNNYTSLSDVIDHIHEIDVGIIGGISSFVRIMKQMLAQNGAEYHTMMDFPVCAIVGPKNPLFKRKGAIKLEEILPYTTVQLTDNTENPLQSIPHALGIANLTHGCVKVNETESFYKIVRGTPLIGLEGIPVERFTAVNQYDDLRILRIADSDLTWQLAWVKSRRIPLSDLAAEFIDLTSRSFQNDKNILWI